VYRDITIIDEPAINEPSFKSQIIIYIGLLEPQDPVSAGPTEINTSDACAFEASRSRPELGHIGGNR